MNYNLIGIDGGATKVSGAIIRQFNRHSFDLASDVTKVLIKDSPFYSTDFKPVEIDALQVCLLYTYDATHEGFGLHLCVR